MTFFVVRFNSQPTPTEVSYVVMKIHFKARHFSVALNNNLGHYRSSHFHMK